MYSVYIDYTLGTWYNITIVKVETHQIKIRKELKIMSTTKTFKEFIDSLKAIEAQITELQAEADAIKDLIKDELTTEGIDEIFIGDYKVIYRPVISNRFDSTSFKKSYAELYRQFTKQTSYKRLIIN